MTKQILVTLSLALLATLASAEFVTLQRAHEIALSDFRAPQSVNGTLGISRCAGCEPGSYRVTSRTRYVVNKRDVDLAEFRRLVSLVRERSSVAVTVLHHQESDTITLVQVTLRGIDQD